MHTTNKHITNFDNSELPIYTFCVAMYNKDAGKEILTIKDKAYDRRDILIENNSALYLTLDHVSLSKFWIVFDIIRTIYTNTHII